MQHDKQALTDLVRRAQAGDKTAFDELYESLYQPLFRFIVAKVRTQEDAEDLTQQTMLKFYQNLARWEDRGYSPTAYLYRIATTGVIDYYRAGHKRPVNDSEDILLSVADQSQDLMADVVHSEQKEALLRLVKKLPQVDQDVLYLRFFAGLPSEEVANVIGKNPAATRKIQSRAIAKLRKLIAQHGPEITI